MSAKTASKVLSGLAEAIELIARDPPGCFTSMLPGCCCKPNSKVEVVLQELMGDRISKGIVAKYKLGI